MKVILVAGERGEGKTTFVKKTVKALKAKGKPIFGFYAENVIDSQNREGYELHNVASDKKIVLCRRDDPKTGELHLMDFWFNTGSIKTGEEWLKQGFSSPDTIFFVDEAGKFELDGYVWNNILVDILNRNKGTLIVTVRNKFVAQIIEKYRLDSKYFTTVSNLLFTFEFADKI